MTKQEHIMDTIIHKKYVLEACAKILKTLFDEDRYDEAYALSKRCLSHDDSKLEDVELNKFIELDNSRKGMINAEVEMTDREREIISTHWSHNRHHPEYFEDYHEMNEIDIMEMCCDWYARSLQFGTDFLSFVNSRQKQRFRFDHDFYQRVMRYCNLLAN